MINIFYIISHKICKKYMQPSFSNIFTKTLHPRVNFQKSCPFKILHRGFSFLDILKMSFFQKPTRLYFLCLRDTFKYTNLSITHLDN